MSESKAAESYNAFEALRNRFGETKKPLKSNRNLSRSKSKDPRSNAPPLVPLIEEGDQTQEEFFQGTRPFPSPVKGKWKNSQCKSNHFNGPDYDSLETSSVASGSSAYSSKEDSLSPTHSSVTELSDMGSVDSFLEYDIQRNKLYPSRTAALKATFEQLSPTKSRDIPNDFVQNRTKVWNSVIGEWIFDGIPKCSSRINRDGMRPPSNEIRVPTPLSTPQFGSTEDLLDSVSKTSLLSNNSDDCDEDIQQPKYKLGTFVHSPQRQSPLVATTSQSPLVAATSQSPLVATTSQSPLVATTSQSPLVATTSQSMNGRSTDCSETGLNKPDAPSRSTQQWTCKDESKMMQEKSTRIGRMQVPTSKSTKWAEAYQKYKGIIEKDQQADHGQQSQGTPQCIAEEPSYSSVVEQRAKLFGGAKRGLRRAQSFQVGPRNSPRTAKRNTYVRKNLSTSFT